MRDLFAGTGFDDIIKNSESRVTRLRSEEYGDLFHELLYRIGYTDTEHRGIDYSIALLHKYKGTEHEETHNLVTQLQIEMWSKMLFDAQNSGAASLDPTPYIEEAGKRFGDIGSMMAMERVIGMDEALKNSPVTSHRYTEWESIESLSALFEGGKQSPQVGTFIDQRYIDFLNRNDQKIEEMHWRKFEELTAEYFQRIGYKVELGPGRNDDGVDVRAWKESEVASKKSDLTIIQCKRQKHKVEKVVVKGLYADLQHYNADLGLIVTSSNLSLGAKETIELRSYPIQEINNEGVKKWLSELKNVGSGIVRC
jgi:restriction system protein